MEISLLGLHFLMGTAAVKLLFPRKISSSPDWQLKLIILFTELTQIGSACQPLLKVEFQSAAIYKCDINRLQCQVLS